MRTLCLLLLAAFWWSESALASLPGRFDVRSFGAKGDGVSDDTAAIQAAADAALALEEKNRMRVGPMGKAALGTKTAVAPEVYFPKGTYRISDTILFQQSVVLKGEPGSIVQQSSPNRDLFYFHYAFRCKVDGLTFDGGAIQLRFWTGNIWSRIQVQNCQFWNAGSDALECLSLAPKQAEGETGTRKPVAPYTVSQEGGRWKLEQNSLEKTEHFYNSTLFSIRNCEFQQCRRVFTVSCDTTFARDLKITARPDASDSVMRLGGQVHLHRIKGIVHGSGKQGACWAEVTGNTAIRDSEFLSSNGIGMPLIYSLVEPTPTFRGVRLEKVRAHGAGGAEASLMVVEEGTMPNLISLSEIDEVSGAPVKAVKWASPPTLSWLGSIARLRTIPVRDQFKIVFGRMSEGVDRTLPSELESICEEAAEYAKVEAIAVPRSWAEATEPAAKPHWKKVLVATEYGLLAKSDADQTDTLEKIFALAAKEAPAKVILPAGSSVTISRSIELPADVRFESNGLARVVQKNERAPHFFSSNARRLEVENLVFVGGKEAFAIAGSPEERAVLIFDGCSFYEQGNAAVEALAGGTAATLPNQWSIRMEDCIFRTGKGLVANAAHSLITAFWAVNGPHLDREAFIENHGGAMRIEAMLGNPRVWIGKRAKRPASIPEWTLGKELRWVDNWGQLHITDSRFGGESGGICNVYHRAEGGSVLVSGGMTRAANSESRPAILYAEAAPKRIVLRDLSGVPGIIKPVLTNGEMKTEVLKSGLIAEIRDQ